MATEGLIKIYGDISEIDTQRVLAAAFEKGLEKGVDFDYQHVRKEDRNMKPLVSYSPSGQVLLLQASGQVLLLQPSGQVLLRQPSGEVPILVDGDVKLKKSREITAYIARKYYNKEADLLCRPLEAETMSHWIDKAQQFDSAVSQACTKLDEGTKSRLCKVLDEYENRLKQSHRLACDCYTLADLHHLPSLQQLMDNAECKKEIIMSGSYPYVRDWARGILARTAWVKKVKPMLQQ